MTVYLSINARLPREAALELSARLLALRPAWDPELDADGLYLFIDMLPGRTDQDLTVVEEACRAVERHRPDLELELEVTRVTEKLRPKPPAALGPWPLILQEEDTASLPPKAEEKTKGNLLYWPSFSRPSQRLWATSELATILILEHLTPPPGAPDTRNKPALTLESGTPTLCLAAALAGASEVALAADETHCDTARNLLLSNSLPVEIFTCNMPFKTLVRKNTHWSLHFGLIAVHLSPYLASRRLKFLASWLEPAGALVVTGFTPGIQTAHLLRAAARAGLVLSTSIVYEDWGAMKLVHAPLRPELPPLTGSVVPDLEVLPEEETKEIDHDTGNNPEQTEVEFYDQESLLPEDEEDKDDDKADDN